MSEDHPGPPSFSRSRKWTLSVNLLFALLAVLALAVMINYLAARHHARWSWSRNAQTELSPLSRRILSGVTNLVKVTIYMPKEHPLYDMSYSLLKTYQLANDKIQLETVDYGTQPGAAEAVKLRYRLGEKDRDIIIFECQGRRKVVLQGELSDLDMQDLIAGRSQEIHRTHFGGEAMFTSAILNVISPRSSKAYFLTGHNELNPESDDVQLGYSKFAGVLQENNVQFERLNLAGPAELPDDCNLLIIAGPSSPLSAEAGEKIERYLKKGGRMLVLLPSYALVQRSLGLEEILQKWGVAVGRNVVRDEKNYVSPNKADLVTATFSRHKLIQPIYYAQLYFIMPRSVAKDSSATSGADAPQVDQLVYTGTSGEESAEVRPRGDITWAVNGTRRNIPLVVAVEKGGIRNVSADRGATRLIVAGDSLFLSNNHIDREANHEFASQAVNWLLAHDELLVNVPHRPIQEYKLTMTAAQMSASTWLLLAGMPGASLLLGTLVWLRRRR